MFFSDPAHASIELIGYGFLAFGVLLFITLYIASRIHDGQKSNG